jgi:hypothetical protein
MNGCTMQTRARVGLFAFCLAVTSLASAPNARASSPADRLSVVVDALNDAKTFDANAERVIRVVGEQGELRELTVKRSLYIDGKLLETSDGEPTLGVQPARADSKGRTLAAARVRPKARLADGYYVEDIQVRGRLNDGTRARGRQVLYYVVKNGAATRISVKEYSEAFAPATTAVDAQGNPFKVRDAATARGASSTTSTRAAERIDG